MGVLVRGPENLPASSPPNKSVPCKNECQQQNNPLLQMFQKKRKRKRQTFRSVGWTKAQAVRSASDAPLCDQRVEDQQVRLVHGKSLVQIRTKAHDADRQAETVGSDSKLLMNRETCCHASIRRDFYHFYHPCASPFVRPYLQSSRCRHSNQAPHPSGLHPRIHTKWSRTRSALARCSTTSAGRRVPSHIVPADQGRRARTSSLR